jgi:hypothetical protein
LLAATAELRAQGAKADAFARCRTIADDKARLRCFESAAEPPSAPPAAPSLQPAAGPWRLIRSPNPRGGPDAVAVMRTADLAQSDLGFAGLMLRCAENAVEIVVVMTEPFPPRSHAKVKILAGGQELAFDASVVPPFSALALPPEVTVLADGVWQSLPRLSIEVDHDHSPIHGTVALAGLGPALALLRSSCPAR